jgi:hypothetical protein
MIARPTDRDVRRLVLARRWSTRGILIGLLGLLVAGGEAAASTTAGRYDAPRNFGPFAWLATTAVPSDWPRLVLPSGLAQVPYPPSFAPIPGDPGTVSAAVHDAAGGFLAYVNATPRQGDEALKGFGAFRVGLLRDEDPLVREEAAGEGLVLRGDRGSCVRDRYVTRIGHHHYREVACLVEGRRGAAVVVAAATVATWTHFEPLLRAVVASFTVE